MPISWDKQRRRFVYTINHRKLIHWYLGMAVVLFGGISGFYMPGRQIFSKISFVPWFIVVLDGFVGFLGAFGEMG